jgi:hypothetical protein
MSVQRHHKMTLECLTLPAFCHRSFGHAGPVKVHFEPESECRDKTKTSFSIYARLMMIYPHEER